MCRFKGYEGQKEEEGQKGQKGQDEKEDHDYYFISWNAKWNGVARRNGVGKDRWRKRVIRNYFEKNIQWYLLPYEYVRNVAETSN